MTLREKIEVMQAFERGEEVEVSDCGYEGWRTVNNPSWSWNVNKYRIKPKPKQVVAIEKWLIYDNLSKSYSIAEESNIDGYISNDRDYLSKVRLLDTKTYEVGLW